MLKVPAVLEDSIREGSSAFMETISAGRSAEAPLVDPVQYALQITLNASFVATSAASLAKGYSVRYEPGVMPLTSRHTALTTLSVASHTGFAALKISMLRTRLQLEDKEDLGFSARKSLDLTGMAMKNTVIAALYGIEAATGRSTGKIPLSALGRAQSGLYAVQASHALVFAARELYARREYLPAEYHMTAIELKQSFEVLKDGFLAKKDNLLVKVGLKKPEPTLAEVVSAMLAAVPSKARRAGKARKQ